MNIPNRLTLLRLIFIFPFVAIGIAFVSLAGPLSFNNLNTKTILFITTGVIFILAMITDFIDGYLARKYNQITTFGKLFDPIADKLIINSALILLSIMTFLPIYITILFIVRDIIVDGMRNLAAKKNIEVAASFWGKAKTMTQSIGIVLVLFFTPLLQNNVSNNFYNNTWEMWIMVIPICLALVFSYIGLGDYFFKIKKYITLK